MTVDEGAVLASLGRLGFGPASFLAAAVACFFESCFCQPLDFAAAAAAAALEADSMAMSGSGGSGGSGGGGSSSGGSGRGSVRGAVRHARLFSEEEVRQVLALGQRLRRRAKPRTFGGSPSGHVVTQVAPQPPTAAEQEKNLYSVAKHSRLKTLINWLPSRTSHRPPRMQAEPRVWRSAARPFGAAAGARRARRRGHGLGPRRRNGPRAAHRRIPRVSAACCACLALALLALSSGLEL